MLSPVDEIKDRLDIVEVVQGYIKLQKAGANYRAVCPFHSDKKPSMFISPAKQIWHCFGCGKGGDIFGFVKEIENVEFGDALRILARKAGVELKKSSVEKELQTARQRLYDICELACRFFQRQLEASKVGEEAKKYLLGRGLSEESIKKWRLGYSPDTWQGLSDFLVGQGYKRDEVEKAGLAINKEGGKFFDRFRGRIMFPIFDLNSQSVGFGGRIFGEKAATEMSKYINTQNTLLYDKSRILYGLDKAKMEIRQKDFFLLVEGYTDVIMCSQAGLGNVVATSGTALTPYQLKILKRYSENMYSSFDTDVAGDTATKRGIDLAQAMGFNIKVVLVPEGKDPAEFILKSPQEWEKCVESAKSILDFYFETTFKKFDASRPEGKKEISKILLPIIKRIPNKIEESYWIQKLATGLQVKESDIDEELNKVKLEISVPLEEFENMQKIETPPKTRKEMLEERLLFLLLIDPNMHKLVKEDYSVYLSQNILNIFQRFKAYFNDDEKIKNFKKEFPVFQKNLSEEENNILNYLSLQAEAEAEEKGIDFNCEDETKICLREIRNIELKNKLDKIAEEIKRAEDIKDNDKLQSLIEKFAQASGEMNSDI